MENLNYNLPDDVIKNPTPNFWVKNLRRDNKIYLVKEKQYAFIEFAYDGSKIGISRNKYGGCESWFVNVDGSGIDGGLLMLPVEGYFSENPENIDNSEIDKLKIEIEILKNKINRIQSIPEISKKLVFHELDREIVNILLDNDFYYSKCRD